jgi:hypothetical protein
LEIVTKLSSARTEKYGRGCHVPLILIPSIPRYVRFWNRFVLKSINPVIHVLLFPIIL